MSGDYELNRIERVYGSVAEYQRCMDEQEERELTDEELEELEAERQAINDEITALSGTPSQVVLELLDWKASLEPKKESYTEYNDYVLAEHTFGRQFTARIIDRIEEVYGVKFSTENNVYKDIEKDKFGITIEQHLHSQIYHPAIININYDLFKRIYRDLCYLQRWPNWFYMSDNGLKYGKRSNLGEVRLFDMKSLGLETDKSLEQDIKFVQAIAKMNQ